jgi:hypothetical protein
MEQEAAGGFASPLPQGAIPVWSLQPQFAGVGQAPVPPPWEAGAGGPSVVQGLGTTIRLGRGRAQRRALAQHPHDGHVAGVVRTRLWLRRVLRL